MNVDDWPSFAEELGRKTAAQLDKWSRAYTSGSITKREFYIAVSALYDATSGLAPKEISNLLADVHRDLRSA